MKEEAATDNPSAEIELGDVSHEAIQDSTPGNQCYVAGKFGARARFIPVYRNLLHHGMEVFIKGGLLRFVNRAGTSHNTKTLWSLLKRRVQLPKSTRFYNCVAELHKFENIRCSEKLLEMGMTGIMRGSKEDLNGGKLLLSGISLPRYGCLGCGVWGVN